MKKITKKHFDRAVAQDWDSHSCLIAQFALDEFGFSDDIDLLFAIVGDSYKARKAMRTFDIFFMYPGDENKPKLQALRASLPIVLE